ncbi:hypothetical protein [Stenotrophomonas sp. C3(2023)]|nr:hypothetical protein [Stenotrophomonas sp. C3(2023)]
MAAYSLPNKIFLNGNIPSGSGCCVAKTVLMTKAHSLSGYGSGLVVQSSQ